MSVLRESDRKVIESLVQAGVEAQTVKKLMELRHAEVSIDAIKKISSRYQPVARATQNTQRVELLVMLWHRIRILDEALRQESRFLEGPHRELRLYIQAAANILSEIDRWAVAAEPKSEKEPEDDLSARV